MEDKDAEGLKPLDEWFIIQQIELPDKMYRVIEHRARKYLDPATGQIHLAPIPDESRGSNVLEKMLGKDFSGIVCADYWGAYRKYARLFDVPVQYCMAYLIREVRFLAEHKITKLSRWGGQKIVAISMRF